MHFDRLVFGRPYARESGGVRFHRRLPLHAFSGIGNLPRALIVKKIFVFGPNTTGFDELELIYGVDENYFTGRVHRAKLKSAVSLYLSLPLFLYFYPLSLVSYRTRARNSYTNEDTLSVCTWWKGALWLSALDMYDFYHSLCISDCTWVKFTLTRPYGLRTRPYKLSSLKLDISIFVRSSRKWSIYDKRPKGLVLSDEDKN